MKSNLVAVIKGNVDGYPTKQPYHPSAWYPEYRGSIISSEFNVVYDMVRNSFAYLGLDIDKYGTKKWNPLSFLINPGHIVFIKPNLISQSTDYDPNSWEHVVTHGSIIRAVIDYVYIALNGEGEIILGDSPQHDSDIDLIFERTGIYSIQEYMWKEFRFEIKIVDLREEVWKVENGIVIEKQKNPKADESIKFTLKGKESYLSEIDDKNRIYYGAFYDIEETNRHHQNFIHEYMISKLPIKADVFINLPKLKTHKKVGVTLNLKAKVGISTRKNWLPHYSIGTPSTNGDQYPEEKKIDKLENFIVNFLFKQFFLKSKIIARIASKLNIKRLGYVVFKETNSKVRSGNWYGNDTCWRMVLDLNRILLYGDPEGNLNSEQRKPYLSIVDGIVGMEGNGPVSGTPIKSGFIAVGLDPLSVDLVCTKLMGFDWKKIKMLYRAFDDSKWPIYSCKYEDIVVVSNIPNWNKKLEEIKKEDCLKFQPHFGWKNKIEL